MDPVTAVIVLLVIAIGMYLVYTYVQPEPIKWIFEAILAVILIVVIMRLAGVDLSR